MDGDTPDKPDDSPATEPDADAVITVSEDGVTLPVRSVLTGRGFITGKSGSGKSNSASVIAEELLAAGYPLCVIDTDGEYVGLAEGFDVVVLGAEATTPDRVVDADSVGSVLETALRERVPVVLDLSGYPDGETELAVVAAAVRALFRAEGELRVPFLLVVEEIHEFLPESGSGGDAEAALVQVAKRGRKRGLGLLGLSQRPAAVDKEFVTQCDWIAWHRLTWENDTRVVARVLDADAAETVGGLSAGEALLVADWDDAVCRVRFRRRESPEAGATPDLDRATQGGGSRTAVLAAGTATGAADAIDRDPTEPATSGPGVGQSSGSTAPGSTGDGSNDTGSTEDGSIEDRSTDDGSTDGGSGGSGSGGSGSDGSGSTSSSGGSATSQETGSRGGDVVALSSREATVEVAAFLQYALETAVRSVIAVVQRLGSGLAAVGRWTAGRLVDGGEYVRRWFEAADARERLFVAVTIALLVVIGLFVALTV